MPKANGKHYSYTRRFDGKTFRSDGRTFSKSKADRVAKGRRNVRPHIKQRVVRLGKSNRFAIYSGSGSGSGC